MLTAEELFTVWRADIRRWIRGSRVREDDIDDVEAIIYRDFLKGGWESRVDVDIPPGKRKASHRTWLFHFTRNRARHFLAACSRDPLRLRVEAKAEPFCMESGRIWGERRIVEHKELVELLRAKLAPMPVRSVVEATGQERSLRCVFEHLRSGFNQAEISRILRCSQASICMMVKAIREIAFSMGLKEELDG